MKIFNKIVWSSKEPNNHNDIWFDGTTFQIYNNGTWESITLEIEAAEKVAEVIKGVSNVYQEKLQQGDSIIIDDNKISVLIDSDLSSASTNPVENRVIASAINKLTEGVDNLLLNFGDYGIRLLSKVLLASITANGEWEEIYSDPYHRSVNYLYISGNILYFNEQGIIEYNSMTTFKKEGSTVYIKTEYTPIKAKTLGIGSGFITIPDEYVPDSIARKTEIPTKLSQLEIDAEIGGETPDWNASEGEKGFIKNRTHYHDFIVKANVDITNTRAGEVINLGFYVNSNTKVRNTITGDIKSFPVDEEFYLPTQGPSVRAKIVNASASLLYILSNNSGVPNILEFGQEIIQPLDDKFISDSIARTSEIPTKLSQLEKDIEVGSDYDDTEIRDAIESIDRKIVELEQDIEGIDRISIDENLSVESTNPVQNKVITAELEKKLEEVDVKQLISREHLYYKYVSAENKVYFKGIYPSYQDWTLLNVFAVNYAVANPITVHMLIEDEGGYIKISTNKFDLITNQRDVFGLFWVYGNLKYNATFDEKNNQVITTEPYEEGGSYDDTEIREELTELSLEVSARWI